MNSREIMKQINGMLMKVDNCYLQIAKAYGMTYNALMTLYMADESDTLTQKHVCDALYLPKSSVHSIIRDLEGRELITLAEGANRKEKYILLTPDGRRTMEKINRDTDRIEGACLQAVSTKDLEQFLEAAKIMAGSMEEETDRIYRP